MDKHANPDRLLPSILLALSVVLPLLSLEAKVLAQEGQPGEEARAERTKTTAEQALDMLENLKARRTELDELRAELKKAGDMAAAAPVRKELSERRSRYRRSLANLVELARGDRGPRDDLQRKRKKKRGKLVRTSGSYFATRTDFSSTLIRTSISALRLVRT